MAPFSFMQACLGHCFPQSVAQGQSRSPSPIRRAGSHNAQLRLNLGLPERQLQLPVIAQSHSQQEPTSSSEPSSYSQRSHNSTPPAPRVKSQRRVVPIAVNGAGKPSWSTANMSSGELAELFDLLHHTLSHIPYAICGLGALIDHGFTARKANKISILCPAHSKDNIKAWAASKGFETQVDSVGLPMQNGTSRRVRIKYLDAGFDRLECVRSSISNATVLSMSSQLDNVAAGWLDNKRRGDERALKTIASDVFWCLDRVARTRQHLNPEFLPTFLGEAFWVPFTETHADARAEMARAGIDVSTVLAGHNAAASLREHDEMLKQYGLVGDVVTQQPAPFENMRDLKNSKSVYTLRGRDSVINAASSTDPMPDMQDIERRVSQAQEDDERRSRSTKVERSPSRRSPTRSSSRKGDKKSKDKGKTKLGKSTSLRNPAAGSKNLASIGRSLTSKAGKSGKKVSPSRISAPVPGSFRENPSPAEWV
ncbi:hypothetical protein F5Y15DRAFT_96595 [Xylariaceae sp. FL0016]|nr:hypothetical protein F5Y15DRAFT_96595 [Xylariaceae sp. FL0016]